MEFDDIISGKEAFLSEAILLETQEGLRLDFKTAAIGKPGAVFNAQGQLTRDGRISLAKALSAFSNSAGGVLIIGVDCRKNSDGVDCAIGLEPFPKWKAALTSVNSAVGDLLQPKNDGLRVEGFPTHTDKTLGYLIVDIPRSERRPHMCQMSGRYFKRSGGASYPMEHFDIEDAFRRTAVPDLKLRIDLKKRKQSGSNAYYRIGLWLENVSSVTAFFPSITINRWTGIQFGWSDMRLPSITRIDEEENGLTVYGDSEFVIHPGSRRQIEWFEFHAAFDEGKRAVIIGDCQPEMAYLRFNYRIGARDMISREEEIEITLYPLK